MTGRSLVCFYGISRSCKAAWAGGFLRIRVATISLLALVLAASVAGADGSRWAAIGPWKTGGANALAIDPKSPQSLFATSGPSIFHSADGGQTWSSAGNGFPAYEVGPIAIDPQSPSTIYAGAGDGIVRSKDNGATWTSVYSSGYSAVISSLAIDPTAPATIYAALTYTGPRPGGIPTPGDVLKSNDGGDTWVLVTSGHFFPAATLVVLDPASDSTLYVGTFGTGSSGAFRSDDSGGSFKALAPSANSCCVRTLAIDSTSSGRVYVGLDSSTEGTLFRSDDRGDTWIEADTGLPNSTDHPGVAALAVLSNSAVLAATPAGLFKSSDAGDTWIAAGNGIEGAVKTLTVAPDGSLAYALTDQGVFVTADSAQSWDRLASPFTPVWVWALARLPGQPEGLLAGTDSGVFLSSNAGASWAAAGAGLPEGDIRAVSVAPSRECATPCSTAVLLAGTIQGLYRSADRGASWSRFESFPPESVVSIAADPSNPDIIYAGTSLGKFVRTLDGGSSWSVVSLGSLFYPVAVIVVDPATPSTLFASTPANVFKSTDGGAIWTALSIGFGADALAVAPGSVYAGTLGGVYRSQDGGATWTLASGGMTSMIGGLPGVPSLGVDPSLPSGAYAGTFEDGIFSTVDGGANWAPLIEGLPFNPSQAYPPVLSIVAGGGMPTTLHAATPFGVYGLNVMLVPDRNIGPLPRRRPSPHRGSLDRF